MRQVTIWHQLIKVDAMPQDQKNPHVTGTLARALIGYLFTNVATDEDKINLVWKKKH